MDAGSYPAGTGGGAFQMYVPQLLYVSRKPEGTISVAMKTRPFIMAPME
jgi:hypothetical protein